MWKLMTESVDLYLLVNCYIQNVLIAVWTVGWRDFRVIRTYETLHAGATVSDVYPITAREIVLVCNPKFKC